MMFFKEWLSLYLLKIYLRIKFNRLSNYINRRLMGFIEN